MANNGLKYLKIDAAERSRQRQAWNRPVVWPVLATLALLGLAAYFARKTYLHRTRTTLQ